MKSIRRFAFFATFVVSTFVCQMLQAQSQEKIYSSLILNFARGIQWPTQNSKDVFTIAVFEYPPLANELKILASNVKIYGRRIEIREFDYADQVGECDLLFIPAYKARTLPRVLEVVGERPTLLVTNKLDYAKIAGGINLILVNGKLQYEINCKAIERKGMKISAALKGMGIQVE